MGSGFISVMQQVTARAAEAPRHIAVSSPLGGLTYGEMDLRSALLARTLRGRGLGPGKVAAIRLGRTPGALVGALAVLRTGAAYVPIDPADPEMRVQRILNDVDAAVSLVDHSCAVGRRPRRCVVIDELGRLMGEATPEPADETVSTRPDDLAYVIYTSGSTGEPKGVEITHAGLSNLVAWHIAAFRVTPATRTSHLARVGFDASIWEIWPALAAGASVHIPAETRLADPALLRDWFVDERVSIAFAPTVLAERLIELEWPEGAALRTLLTGADTLRRFPPPGLPFILVNNYGPTECTVVATSGRVPPEPEGGPGGLPTIGAPISEIEALVLDEDLKLAPDGTVGELGLAGPGLARGYRNRPDLTAERFVAHPFRPGARMFRTGDLARRLPGGEFQFLGRRDDLVKLRGFRIEPGEVEAALQAHPAVRRCVVTAREMAGERRLVAYFEARPGARPALRQIREFLGERLPDFMVPTAYVAVPALPETANGKLDRSRLPDPEAEGLLQDDADAGPATPTERLVAGILAPLLGLERVGRRANFFELGGHSLLGTQVVVRIRERLGVDLPLRSVFERPTVEELAGEIDRLQLAAQEPAGDEETPCMIRA